MMHSQHWQSQHLDADTNLSSKTKVAASQTAVDKAQQGLEKANQSDEERQKKLAEATANSKADDAVLTSKQAFDDASAKAESKTVSTWTAKPYWVQLQYRCPVTSISRIRSMALQNILLL